MGQFRGIFLSTIAAIISDHLGSPRKIMDLAGTLEWSWTNTEPYGYQAPNELHTSTKFTYDGRFPGQRFDASTGTLHNGFRTYSPKLGRYIQSDPMGLLAGWNTYAYVGGSPTRFMDPMGLSRRDYKEKIPKIFQNAVITMVREGRRSPGSGSWDAWMNNLSSALPGSRYEVCVGQSEFVKQELDYHQKEFDDHWTFQRNRGPGHHWITAYSNNPNDPILLIDPWYGSISEGVSGYSAFDEISAEQIEKWRSPYIIDYLRGHAK